MSSLGVLTLVSVATIGILLFALGLSYLRARRESNATGPFTDETTPLFTFRDPSIRSPAGSIAERRQIIEDILRRKERPQN